MYWSCGLHFFDNNIYGVYINFAPKMPFSLQFSNLNFELGMPVTLIFSSPGHRSDELLSWVVVRPSVRKLFTFKSSSLKPLNRFQPNLPEMFIGWYSTRFMFLVLIRNPTWLPGSTMCSHWLKF